MLRLWKFTEHHSGFPEISYVGKCVFQVRFPHQCLTGISRVPGCASLSWPLFFSYLYFKTTTSPHHHLHKQRHLFTNNNISTNKQHLLTIISTAPPSFRQQRHPQRTTSPPTNTTTSSLERKPVIPTTSAHDLQNGSKRRKGQSRPGVKGRR